MIGEELEKMMIDVKKRYGFLGLVPDCLFVAPAIYLSPFEKIIDGTTNDDAATYLSRAMPCVVMCGGLESAISSASDKFASSWHLFSEAAATQAS